MKVSVLIPILDAEPQLAETVARLDAVRRGLDLEILLVVDVPDLDREGAARARNDEVAEAAGGRAVYRIGQRGFGSALRLGFSEASGEAVIPFMGDACDDPADIPALIGKLETGWDVVAGSRYMPGGRIVGDTFKQRMSKLYCWMVRLVGGPPIHDVANAFKAYRRTVLESVPTAAESYDISVELTVKAHQQGFSVTEVPTTWTNRELGESNWRVSDELRRYNRWLLLALSGRRRARRARASTVRAVESSEER
jgi:glycosyltransferase involved in cell wall biosynthesis